MRPMIRHGSKDGGLKSEFEHLACKCGSSVDADMNRLLDKCEQECGGEFEHKELLSRCMNVREHLKAVYTKIVSLDRRMKLEELYGICEEAAPGVIFPGCGALFDIYFVMVGPANMQRIMMSARRGEAVGWVMARTRCQKK